MILCDQIFVLYVLIYCVYVNNNVSGSKLEKILWAFVSHFTSIVGLKMLFDRKCVLTCACASKRLEQEPPNFFERHATFWRLNMVGAHLFHNTQHFGCHVILLRIRRQCHYLGCSSHFPEIILQKKDVLHKKSHHLFCLLQLCHAWSI